MRWWVFTKLNCDYHYMMYVNQIIMLYTLNLHSAVCQLYLNNTGWKIIEWTKIKIKKTAFVIAIKLSRNKFNKIDTRSLWRKVYMLLKPILEVLNTCRILLEMIMVKNSILLLCYKQYSNALYPFILIIPITIIWDRQYYYSNFTYKTTGGAERLNDFPFAI